jgi:flagellar basal-body rod protein FlgF
MYSGLYTSASGLMTSQYMLDIISNNLANANTVGFKRSKPFVTYLENASKDMELKQPINKDINAAVKIGGDSTDLSPGNFKKTGGDLDMAITGDGFFAVLTPNGVKFTRAGNFTMSEGNALRTVQGYPVLNDNLGEINISGDDIKIDNSGIITADGVQVDKLGIFDIDKDDIVREGENLFNIKDKTKEPTKSVDYKVNQGYLEMSNVNSIDEMVKIIELTRSAQFYQKMISTVMDDTTQRVVSQVGIVR